MGTTLICNDPRCGSTLTSSPPPQRLWSSPRSSSSAKTRGGAVSLRGMWLAIIGGQLAREVDSDVSTSVASLSSVVVHSDVTLASAPGSSECCLRCDLANSLARTTSSEVRTSLSVTLCTPRCWACSCAPIGRLGYFISCDIGAGSVWSPHHSALHRCVDGCTLVAGSLADLKKPGIHTTPSLLRRQMGRLAYELLHQPVDHLSV